ncbi:MAG: hypothetical protein L6R40_007856 [Gallowayella cf. fulva]|nr:MAG: hypothetical protein L6R40_007856 [Xanthomendoza cf. fulva]
MDLKYDELLPDSRRTKTPVTDIFRPSYEHLFAQSTMGPSESMVPSWSMENVTPSTNEAAYTTEAPSSMLQSELTQTYPQLQMQNVPGQDSLILSAGFNQASDLAAFYNCQSSSYYTTPNASTNASTSSSLNSHTALNGDSSSGSNRVVPSSRITASQSSQNTSHQQDTPLKKNMTCRNSPKDCISSALEMLQTLHVPATACLCSSNEVNSAAEKRQPRQTDSVLSTNRTAVRRLSDMLRCACIGSSQLQLVLVIIFNKLMAWYRAVLQSFPDRCQGPREDAAMQVDDLDEQVLYQPFTVGKCSIDAELESKICAQVICSELRQLDSLAVILTNRLQEEDVGRHHTVPSNRSHQSTLTINAPRLSSTTTGSRLTAHLHKEMQEMKSLVGEG